MQIRSVTTNAHPNPGLILLAAKLGIRRGHGRNMIHSFVKISGRRGSTALPWGSAEMWHINK
jgi:hypothetical protein